MFPSGPEAIIVMAFSIVFSLIPFALTIYIAWTVHKLKATVDSIDHRLANLEHQRPPSPPAV